MAEEYHIRRMGEKDIPVIAQSLNAVGRLPVGLNETLLRNDWKRSPEGCIVAVNSQGKVICQCATVAVDEKEAYFVYYRTDEAYRGRGIGSKVFAASTKALEPRNIALTSREPMTTKYMKADFPFYGFSIRNLVFKRNLEQSMNKQSEQRDFILKPVDPSMHNDIFAYLNSVLKMSEQDFNQVFLKVSSHVTAAIKDGAVVGFGALQEMNDHFRVTPLYAHNKEIFRGLLNHLLSQIPDSYTVIMPLPDVNRDFVNDFMEANGYSLESEAFIDKIYSKRNVDLNFDKVFSFWNIEIVYQ